ncbi:autoinducer binding domain-containing protein [Aeromonas jandaei]|uniref:autoinducer binding domain-containing protein n=1 Tax=Aeromonas jandaei TaxID=650 RepID=UPI001ADDC5DB
MTFKLSTGPDEWGRRYRAQGFWAIDPIVRKGMTHSTPIFVGQPYIEYGDQQDSDGDVRSPAE